MSFTGLSSGIPTYSHSTDLTNLIISSRPTSTTPIPHPPPRKTPPHLHQTPDPKSVSESDTSSHHDDVSTSSGASGENKLDYGRRETNAGDFGIGRIKEELYSPYKVSSARIAPHKKNQNINNITPSFPRSLPLPNFQPLRSLITSPPPTPVQAIVHRTPEVKTKQFTHKITSTKKKDLRGNDSESPLKLGAIYEQQPQLMKIPQNNLASGTTDHQWEEPEPGVLGKLSKSLITSIPLKFSPTNPPLSFTASTSDSSSHVSSPRPQPSNSMIRQSSRQIPHASNSKSPTSSPSATPQASTCLNFSASKLFDREPTLEPHVQVVLPAVLVQIELKSNQEGKIVPPIVMDKSRELRGTRKNNNTEEDIVKSTRMWLARFTYNTPFFHKLSNGYPLPGPHRIRKESVQISRDFCERAKEEGSKAKSFCELTTNLRSRRYGRGFSYYGMLSNCIATLENVRYRMKTYIHLNKIKPDEQSLTLLALRTAATNPPCFFLRSERGREIDQPDLDDVSVALKPPGPSHDREEEKRNRMSKVVMASVGVTKKANLWRRKMDKVEKKVRKKKRKAQAKVRRHRTRMWSSSDEVLPRSRTSH
ncbi:hypothetical protein TL16_g11015 [Triparma laevis f. inornata]|uniref:Uncharacterized protein n=1 Tax=Triparma laevis f. inornata TaxID=1714386 RepID=A0A9W7EQL1_9STRA|nr:hypothetical protein TL16_g11015 [Triparma laevis f. inornata]